MDFKVRRRLGPLGPAWGFVFGLLASIECSCLFSSQYSTVFLRQTNVLTEVQGLSAVPMLLDLAATVTGFAG